MKITINGLPQEIPDSPSLQQLLKLQGVESEYIAVAVNRKFVPRGTYEATYIHENDEVEILSPMQGG